MQPLCDLRDFIRRHWSPVLPTQPLPRKAEHILKGGKHFNHVPQLTLIYFPPKSLLRKFYWCVKCYYGVFHYPLADFELTILLVTLHYVRWIFYPLCQRMIRHNLKSLIVRHNLKKQPSAEVLYNLLYKLKTKIHYMINHIWQIIKCIWKNQTIFEHYY